MANELIVKNIILISAPMATVWDVLVNPEQTKKYMFGCETVSNWQVGDELLWRGELDGKPMVFVKGTIVAIKHGSYLAYTTIDPSNTAMADVPENYLTVTYTLEDRKGETELTVTQGDYTKVAEGEKRYEEAVAAGGWDSILEQIKGIAQGD